MVIIGRCAIFRNRVGEVRRARGLSVDQLGVYADVNRTTVATLEKDDGYEPHGSTMRKLAQFFGVRLGDLFWIEGEDGARREVETEGREAVAGG